MELLKGEVERLAKECRDATEALGKLRGFTRHGERMTQAGVDHTDVQNRVEDIRSRECYLRACASAACEKLLTDAQA